MVHMKCHRQFVDRDDGGVAPALLKPADVLLTEPGEFRELLLGEAARLDHNAGRNAPDNLAWLCWTHHWMFDADFYPLEAIRQCGSAGKKPRGFRDGSR